jgi:hypothetical protein
MPDRGVHPGRWRPRRTSPWRPRSSPTPRWSPAASGAAAIRARLQTAHVVRSTAASLTVLSARAVGAAEHAYGQVLVTAQGAYRADL